MSERIAVVLVDPATGLPYTAIPVNIGSTVNRTASDNVTSTQNVALSTAACGSAAFQVMGTWTGTLVFEYTIDDLSWVALSVTPDGGGPAVSSTTTNGNWSVQVESYSQVRVRGNTVGFGTAAVFLSASTATSVVTVAGPLPIGDNTIGRVKVTDGTNVAAVSSGGALSVDASATTTLPLPTGAASSAAQATSNASLTSIDGKLPALSGGRVPVAGPLTDAELRATAVPVSGTVTATGPLTDVQLRATAVPVSAASLPLPLGAATAAKQPDFGIAGTPSADVLTVQGDPAMTPLLVDGSGTPLPVSGTVDQGAPNTYTMAWPVLVSDGSSFLGVAARPFRVDPTGTTAQPISAGVLGATTDTSATTTSIHGATRLVASRLPTALGQTTKAASMSVALASDQVGTAGSSSATVLSVQGIASGTTLLTTDIASVTQNSTTSGQSGGLVQGAVTTAAPSYTTARSNPLSLTTGGALRVDASAATVTVTGTLTANAGSGTLAVSAASLPLPSGAATSANQTSEIAALGTTSDTSSATTIIGRLQKVVSLLPPSVGNNTSANGLTVTEGGSSYITGVTTNTTTNIWAGGGNVKKNNYHSSWSCEQFHCMGQLDRDGYPDRWDLVHANTERARREFQGNNRLHDRNVGRNTRSHPRDHQLIQRTERQSKMADLVSITVAPVNPSIDVEAVQQMTAMAVYSDATTSNVTKSVTWGSSESGVATVSDVRSTRGLVTGIDVGDTVITAIYLGKVGYTVLSVV